VSEPEHALPSVGVVLPAAGSGLRMGGASKAFLELDGKPLLAHALHPFLQDPRVVAIAISLTPREIEEIPGWIIDLDNRITMVGGGKTRTESVRNALSILPMGLDVIAIHDAARPLVTSATIRECIDIAGTGICAVAGCPVIDTVKVVDEELQVLDTPDRDVLWHAHTPQVFPAELILQAYESEDSGTDDAVMLESFDTCIRMVDDGGTNIKVTRPADMAIAGAILKLQGADV